MAPARGFRVSLDLRVHGFAETEPLVPQLVDVFRLLVARRVHIANSFEQA
jgi:hypothetical protein